MSITDHINEIQVNFKLLYLNKDQMYTNWMKHVYPYDGLTFRNLAVNVTTIDCSLYPGEIKNNSAKYPSASFSTIYGGKEFDSIDSNTVFNVLNIKRLTFDELSRIPVPEEWKSLEFVTYIKKLRNLEFAYHMLQDKSAYSSFEDYITTVAKLYYIHTNRNETAVQESVTNNNTNENVYIVWRGDLMKVGGEIWKCLVEQYGETYMQNLRHVTIKDNNEYINKSSNNETQSTQSIEPQKPLEKRRKGVWSYFKFW